MDLYPAVDLRGGRCVRLVEGDFDQETVYGDDPVAVARSFEAAGASWIHVVDLDAARRTGNNTAVIQAIASAVAIPIEVGGGVRDGALLKEGIARVVVGSMAVEDPASLSSLAETYPGRVAVGLDHRSGEVRLRGWEEGAGVDIIDVLPRVTVPGVAAVIVTAIERDGRLVGPDVEGLSRVLAVTDVPVIASGGVAGLQDLRALADLRSGGRGLAGVIVGKALYEGRFGIDEALQTVQGTSTGA
jgi:phosphoribosylformimino-5-aminoimidazole carboxamide ribotide isomerase